MKTMKVPEGAAVGVEVATFAARATAHLYYQGGAVDLEEKEPGVFSASLTPPPLAKGALLQWSVYQHGGSVWRCEVRLKVGEGEPEVLVEKQGEAQAAVISGDVYLFGVAK